MSPEGSSLLFQAVPASLKFSVQEKRVLREFTKTVEEQVAGGRSFCCLLTNDRELRRMNRDFLQHDYPTDVLSFPAASANGALGELAISTERAAAQAAEFGHTLLDEVRILMLHGVLHLPGMDHERDRGEMGRAERKWRTQLGLPNSLIARARQ
jgi:probable rRNA maturation factor